MTTSEDDKIARAWAYTYEIYRWHYLVCGPEGFDRRAPAARPEWMPLLGPRGEDVSLLKPTTTKWREYLTVHGARRESSELSWTEDLEYALCALATLHAECPDEDRRMRYLKHCAWQAVDNTRSHLALIKGKEAQKALEYLEQHCSNPFGEGPDDRVSLGDAPLSDERSELKIVSGEYPRYTYQVTVDRPFDEVLKMIISSKHWKSEKCGRLLSLGPSIDDDEFQEARDLTFIFPTKNPTAKKNKTEAWEDWKGQEETVQYATDLSKNDSTMRLDFSLIKPEPSSKAARHALLVEDCGYYLARKSLAKVGRTDLIVHRTLWFSGRAFRMNAALRPLFKMIVDHRVLREFSEICKGKDDDKGKDKKRSLRPMSDSMVPSGISGPAETSNPDETPAKDVG